MLLVKCLRLSRNSKRWERQSNLWRTDNTIFFTMSIHDKKDNPSAVTLYTDTMCQGDTPWLQADWKKRPSLTLWPPRVRICNTFWLNGQKASAVLSSIIKPECDNKCCFERKLKILRSLFLFLVHGWSKCDGLVVDEKHRDRSDTFGLVCPSCLFYSSSP